MIGRRLVLIALVAVLAFSLAGCAKSYIFNFEREQSLSNYQGTWLEYGEPLLFEDEGAYLDGNAITCPFKFGGDFTMEVYFFINTADTNYLQWLDFYLVDSSDWGYGIWIGMGMQQTSIADSIHWFGQSGVGNLPGMLPHLNIDGNNKAVYEKVGDVITLYLNDEELTSFTIAPENQIDYYRPLFSAYDDEQDQWKGLYLQKVVVKYESGNMVP